MKEKQKMANCRIRLEDSLVQMLTKMGDGNFGGITVCTRIIKEGKKIDPQGDPLLLILMLDTFGIYGSRIWMLYKDVCGENLSKTIAMIRCVQMGILDEDKLHYAINNRGSGIDIAELCTKLKDELREFNFKENNNEEILSDQPR